MSEAAKARPLTEKRVETLRKAAKEKSRAVIAINKETGEKTLYKTVIGAAEQTGVKHPHISRCLHGRRPSAGGYYWEYADNGGD